MREDLKELWDSIEARKWRVLEAVARLPQDVQAKKMPKSNWTPIQLIEHLVMAEEQQLREIELSKKEEAKAHRGLMYRSAVWILRQGIRVPPPKSMLPSGTDDSLESLQKRWDDVRSQLWQALEGARDNRPFASHAQLGALTPDQVLTITDAHLQYHQRQIGG